MNIADKFRKCRIGVLAGGFSSERAVSLKSGSAVARSLRTAGLDVKLIDVVDDKVAGLDGVDVVFIALHGKFGEDGSVQRLLEGKNIPYTGSDGDASALAFDKIAAKKVLEENDIPTPAYTVLTVDNRIDERKISFPCVVKPPLEGSSVGLTIARDAAGLKNAVGIAKKYGNSILIEEYIPGREITVGILEDEPLPVVEIHAIGGVYDYEAKYIRNDTRYIVPAELEKEVYEKAQELGIWSHRSLGCKDFSRVDMRANGGDIYVLEINTIPGFTERSLLPMAAKARGMDFTELCLRILDGAWRTQITRIDDTDYADGRRGRPPCRPEER